VASHSIQTIPIARIFRVRAPELPPRRSPLRQQRHIVLAFLMEDVVREGTGANHRDQRPCLFLHFLIAQSSTCSPYSRCPRESSTNLCMRALPHAKQNLVSFSDDHADTDVRSVFVHRFSPRGRGFRIALKLSIFRVFSKGIGHADKPIS